MFWVRDTMEMRWGDLMMVQKQSRKRTESLISAEMTEARL